MTKVSFNKDFCCVKWKCNIIGMHTCCSVIVAIAVSVDSLNENITYGLQNVEL